MYCEHAVVEDLRVMLNSRSVKLQTCKGLAIVASGVVAVVTAMMLWGVAAPASTTTPSAAPTDEVSFSRQTMRWG
ncbi:hypothetical protein DFJ66_1650 [Saccharothrix variisporea]|uniref:Uncharacterized protein n=1 Tax=Saccharothrix variisporea TaxID=543527 RepID=A0A495X5H8_9PSEU|nr:hypothetical protein DFJ66_1650 [Saccharothrix variisporea]